MRELGIGVVGCGSIGRIHAQHLDALPAVRVVALADAQHDVAQALAETLRNPRVADCAEALLDDARVHAVVIATHNDSHVPLALAAIARGKAVLLEKPMALELEAAVRLAREVEERRVPLMLAFKLRFEPLVERARAVVPQPHMTIGQLFDPPWPENGWFMDPVRGGGNILAQGCHLVDLVCHLNPCEPVLVQAAGGAREHPSHAVPDTLAMILRFANGAVASLAMGDNGPAPLVSKFSVQCLAGGRTAHLHARLVQGSFCDGHRTWEEQAEGEFGFAREAEAFVNSLRNGRPLPCDHRDGLRSVVLLHLALESARDGLPKPVPPMDHLLGHTP